MRARCYDFRLSVLGGVAVGLLAFAVPAAATVASGAAAPATSLDEAWRACNAQQLAAADRIASCTTIIESGRAKRAARAQALTARGFGYLLQKDFDRARADFDAAIANNPKLAAAYYYRAAIQMQRDPQGALADINRAISLNPKDPDYFRERGSLYAKRKEYPRAIADLTTAIGLAKKPMREYFLRGAAYEYIGQRDKAIADFQASLVLDPDNDVLRRHLVHLGGEIPKAVQLPSGLCSANDITHEQRIAGCTASIESGTLTGWPLKVAYCNRGYALTELGEYDRVIADSDALIAIDPQAGCGYLNRARGWYYKHDLDRAIADYTQAIAFEPRLHEAYASRGTAYFDRREFGKAIADYSAAISIDSDIPMYFSDRGNTRYMMGDYRAAIADYNRAIKVDPDYSQAYARRGWAFLYLDELANAEADFDKALELAPGDAYAKSGRAEVHQRQNKPVPEERSTGLSFDNLRRMVEQPGEAAAKQDHP
jgi:tetratricopeptide (TPR) repeat protein